MLLLMLNVVDATQLRDTKTAHFFIIKGSACLFIKVCPFYCLVLNFAFLPMNLNSVLDCPALWLKFSPVRILFLLLLQEGCTKLSLDSGFKWVHLNEVILVLN